MEESVLFEGCEEARRRVEAGDVVVGRLNAVGGSGRRHLEYVMLLQCQSLVAERGQLRMLWQAAQGWMDVNLLVKTTPSLLGLVDQYR